MCIELNGKVTEISGQSFNGRPVFRVDQPFFFF